MENGKHRMIFAWACLCAFSATAMEATLMPDGGVRFGERELRPLVFLNGWRGAALMGSHEITKPGMACIWFDDHERRVMDGSVSLVQLGGGRVRIDYLFTAVRSVELESLGCFMTLPTQEVSGRKWCAEGRCGLFAHPEGGGIHLSYGRLASLEFPLARSGAEVRFSTTNAVNYLIQDDRIWSEHYTVRFGALLRRRYREGDRLAFSLEVSADAPLTAADQRPFVIAAGRDWIPLTYHRDIEAGSALDFSQMGFTDAPAGRHGWLRNVGGHFEFERLPGRPQRFYGVNLCGTANFPDHALADALVTRFRRIGYNAIRLHHHDNGMVQGSADGLTLNAGNMDRFDYLLAAAIREGLYLTTDIYVSRGHSIKWRHIGVDRDGTIDIQHFKALCAVYEPAFANWAAYARNILLHRNPYTGRRYIDEPALPLISLVNEGGLFMGWNRGVRDDPRIVAAWREWLAAKRVADPAFAPGVASDRLPDSFWGGPAYPFVAQWTGELEARMVARMKSYLRKLGCKALLTNDNCGPHYAALQLATADYDYIDDHFYVDHPSFLKKPWSLPSRCQNRNPLLGRDPLPPCRLAFTRMLDKPFTVTEWNFSGPGRYRGVGGILAGAIAAMQDWDGMWRFAYSHGREMLKDADQCSPGYFDLSSDPLTQASERASICLFLRGDIAPFTGGMALWVTPESAAWSRVLSGAPSWSEAAWRMRVGSCLSQSAAGVLRAIRRETADDPAVTNAIAAVRSPEALRIDRERGSFTIDTPRTCGGFAPGGEIAAGALSANVTGAPATVWVHALDGEVVSLSRRMLLTHLTDVQGDGVRFADEGMTVLLKWGGRPLVRNGAAEIALRLAEPERYAVHELSTGGRRMREIPSSVADGRFRFTASVDGENGARMLYEIVAR